MRKGIVVDLDGSLVKANTFQRYVAFAAGSALSAGRLDIAAALSWWVSLRKCRCVTHGRMKRQVLWKTRSFMDGRRLEGFVDTLMDDVNARVREILEAGRGRGYYVCLSTAAPESYARIISGRLGLDGYCASPVPADGDGGWRENVREAKRDNTLGFLRERGVEMSVLVTDHHDDLPLLRESKDCNYLVDPSPKTLEACRAAGISFELLVGG